MFSLTSASLFAGLHEAKLITHLHLGRDNEFVERREKFSFKSSPLFYSHLDWIWSTHEGDGKGITLVRKPEGNRSLRIHSDGWKNDTVTRE
jgi:hypothetical protein